MRRVATPVDWLFAPDWLTVEQACELSGWDTASLLEIVGEGGVDLDDTGLIEKQSLHEFQEVLAEVLHWHDDKFQPHRMDHDQRGGGTDGVH